MLATDTHLQVTPDCLAAFHSDRNQLAHTLEIVETNESAGKIPNYS